MDSTTDVGDMNAALAQSSTVNELRSHLRNAICAGVWGPGERIPELEVARGVGVSRTPVREALRALAGEGLVDARYGKGFTVCYQSLRQLSDSYRVRKHIEGEAVYDAATHANKHELVRLEALLYQSEELNRTFGRTTTADNGALSQVNADFHGLILRASGSQIFERQVSPLIHRPLVYRAHSWYDGAARSRSDQCHRDILNALKDRSPNTAQSLMISHIDEIASHVMKALRAYPQYLAEERDGRTDRP